MESGSPRAIVSSNTHAVLWRWDSPEPFGLLPPNDNPSALGAYRFNLRFPGQVNDAESGTFYNHHRDYGAWTGRYGSRIRLGWRVGSIPTRTLMEIR